MKTSRTLGLALIAVTAMVAAPFVMAQPPAGDDTRGKRGEFRKQRMAKFEEPPFRVTRLRGCRAYFEKRVHHTEMSRVAITTSNVGHLNLHHVVQRRLLWNFIMFKFRRDLPVGDD